MESLHYPGAGTEDRETPFKVDEAWRTSQPFSMDDIGAIDPPVDEQHISGTQLRHRLISAETVADAAAQEEKVSLLQRLSRHLPGRR